MTSITKTYSSFRVSCLSVMLILLTPVFLWADGKLVRVVGTDSVLRCHEEIIKAYANQDPSKSEITYKGGGTYLGIKLFCEGKADVVAVGVRLTEKHTKLLTKSFPDPNKQPREMIFSQTALVFIVHRSNRISRITQEQLKDIFLGKITKWSAIGTGVGKINLYGTARTRSSTSILKKNVLKIRRWPAEGVTFCGKAKDVIGKVSKDRYGIGYILAPNATVLKKVKALAIAKDDNGKAIAPERENLLLETYPLVLKIKLLVHPNASQAALKFCKYACSEKVAGIVREYGFFPVSEREQLFMQKRLREMKAGKGPKVRAVGAKGCGELLDGLAVDYVMATAVIQM
ncbi:MAG: substrate-binding domain-containing protein, partial [Phycisphaerae bacterium]|nr:substrate-binding domain-containing protein [Phycisphaerae bacterium]